MEAFKTLLSCSVQLLKYPLSINLSLTVTILVWLGNQTSHMGMATKFCPHTHKTGCRIQLCPLAYKNGQMSSQSDRMISG